MEPQKLAGRNVSDNGPAEFVSLEGPPLKGLHNPPPCRVICSLPNKREEDF